MPEAGGWIALCDASAVTPDTPCRAEHAGRSYAIFRIGAQCYVTEDACSHGPGSLADGYVDGEEVECPFHQGRFHIPTGQPSAAPCTIPLRVWPVRLIDDKVCIDPEAA